MYGIYSKQYDQWTTYYDPQEKEVALLSSLFDATQKDILDIGCGTGRLSFMFAKKANKVIGIDIDVHSIEYCKNKSEILGLTNCNFIVADALSFYSNNKFDIILFSWSLYQIKYMFAAVHNATKLLKNNGILLILQPVGGNQEDVFDMEYKKCKKSYDEIYNLQVNICLELFDKINECLIDTDFVYPNMEEAIKNNLFFYKLFNPQFLESKNNLDLLQKRLSFFLQDNQIVLSDATKIIVSKGCDRK